MATETKAKLTTREFALRTVDLIGKGKLDRHLESIVNSANARRRALREQQATFNMAMLSDEGTRVRIVGTIKPKYLLGQTGSVVAKPSTFAPGRRENLIYVNLDAGIVGMGRRKYGPVVGVPAVCLEEE